MLQEQVLTVVLVVLRDEIKAFMASCGYSCFVGSAGGPSSFNPANVQCVSIGDCNRGVTKTRNGERGTGNREPGTGVWERVYSGNPYENSKWRTKTRK